jgi:RNA polymerase sigma-70 factor (ECF subfamily)
MEDKLLAWELHRGNRKALCRIYEKYKKYLLRIAAGLLNDTVAAEDAVQDVFTNMVRSAGKYRITTSLKVYLATCVANKARDIYRSQTKNKAEDLDHIPQVVCQYRRPEQWIILNEQFTRATEAVGQLPLRQKEAVILRVQGGLKFREIAKLQQTSIKTVISRYRYGLDKLRSIMNDKVTK